jgi:hypothetical protein
MTYARYIGLFSKCHGLTQQGRNCIEALSVLLKADQTVELVNYTPADDEEVLVNLLENHALLSADKPLAITLRTLSGF